MNQVGSDQRVYFRNLDVLRFFAAYLIVLLHCVFGWKAFFGHPAAISSPGIAGRLELVVNNFSFGVDIFFLISGFLITFLLLSELENNGKVDVTRFYIRRAFRIWPLYFLLVLVAPLLTYFFYEQSPSYLHQFLFAGNFGVISEGTKSAATDHLWSICIEEHFYLFCPLLIAFIPIKRIPQFLLGVICLCIFFRAYVSLTDQNYGMTLYMHTLSRIDVLAMGSLFGYLFYYNKIKFDHPLPVRAMVYLVFVALFLMVSYNECGTLFTASFKKYFFVLLAAYWAGNFLFNPDAKLAITRPGILHYAGKVSYGIYMYNPVIIFLILKFFKAYSIQNYFLFFSLVHLVLAITVFASYRFIELPFLQLKEKYAVIKSGGKLNNEIQEGEIDASDSEEKIVQLRIDKRA
jgi:peptidoglycan/LPS O-acetylase OafA/YrhL